MGEDPVYDMIGIKSSKLDEQISRLEKLQILDEKQIRELQNTKIRVAGTTPSSGVAGGGVLGEFSRNRVQVGDSQTTDEIKKLGVGVEKGNKRAEKQQGDMVESLVGIGKSVLPIVGISAGIGTMVALAKGYSESMHAQTELFGHAMKVFFKPFGDFLGALLMPSTIELYKFAINFNRSWGGKLANLGSDLAAQLAGEKTDEEVVTENKETMEAVINALTFGGRDWVQSIINDPAWGNVGEIILKSITGLGGIPVAYADTPDIEVIYGTPPTLDDYGTPPVIEFVNIGGTQYSLDELSNAIRDGIGQNIVYPWIDKLGEIDPSIGIDDLQSGIDDLYNSVASELRDAKIAKIEDYVRQLEGMGVNITMPPIEGLDLTNLDTSIIRLQNMIDNASTGFENLKPKVDEFGRSLSIMQHSGVDDPSHAGTFTTEELVVSGGVWISPDGTITVTDLSKVKTPITEDNLPGYQGTGEGGLNTDASAYSIAQANAFDNPAYDQGLFNEYFGEKTTLTLRHFYESTDSAREAMEQYEAYLSTLNYTLNEVTEHTIPAFAGGLTQAEIDIRETFAASRAMGEEMIGRFGVTMSELHNQWGVTGDRGEVRGLEGLSAEEKREAKIEFKALWEGVDDTVEQKIRHHLLTDAGLASGSWSDNRFAGRNLLGEINHHVPVFDALTTQEQKAWDSSDASLVAQIFSPERVNEILASLGYTIDDIIQSLVNDIQESGTIDNPYYQSYNVLHNKTAGGKLYQDTQGAYSGGVEALLEATNTGVTKTNDILGETSSSTTNIEHNTSDMKNEVHALNENLVGVLGGMQSEIQSLRSEVQSQQSEISNLSSTVNSIRTTPDIPATGGIL